MTTLPITPRPTKQTIKIHGKTTPDPYRWFRKDKSFMKTYAKNNNEYTLDHLTQLDSSNSLFNTLVTEFKSRTALRYTTVPSKYKSFVKKPEPQQESSIRDVRSMFLERKKFKISA